MLPSIPVQILRQREEKRQILLFGSLNSSNRKLSFRHVTATLSVHLRRFIRLKMFPLVLRGLSSKKRRDQIHLSTLKQSYMIVGNYQRRERPSKHCVDICPPPLCLEFSGSFPGNFIFLSIFRSIVFCQKSIVYHKIKSRSWSFHDVTLYCMSIFLGKLIDLSQEAN